MSVTRPSTGKYICGMVASLAIFLAGAWLILAPFALGYQPYGADWMSQTTNDFVVGICVAVVALVSFGFFFFMLLGSLRAAGVIAARSRSQAGAAGYASQAAPAPVTVPTAAAPQSDLDRTLATLAQALAADLTMRKQGSVDAQTQQAQANQLPEQYNITNRRDA